MLISLNLEYYHDLNFCHTVFILLLDFDINGRVEGDRKESSKASGQYCMGTVKFNVSIILLWLKQREAS